jgi:hypothetical protein
LFLFISSQNFIFFLLIIQIRSIESPVKHQQSMLPRLPIASLIFTIQGLQPVEVNRDLSLDCSMLIHDNPVNHSTNHQINLPQSMLSLTGTGALEHSAQIELVSNNDTVFAKHLAKPGTFNLQESGIQTFVGAQVADITANETEGGLNLVRNTVSAVMLGSLYSSTLPLREFASQPFHRCNQRS